MGVKGLWQILEPVGKPVSLESLEGKVLAIDVSLWLHQAIRGSASHQAGTRNPHLVTMFQRIVKLLFYRIRPVFVFDGLEIPALKRRTLSKRKLKKELASLQLTKMQRKLLAQAAKTDNGDNNSGAEDDSEASAAKKMRSLAGAAASVAGADEQLFNLPLPRQDAFDDLSSDNDSDDVEDIFVSTSAYSVHDESFSSSVGSDDTVDVNSEQFKALPTEIQRELLVDMQEKNKDARIRNERLPEKMQDFSQFQLGRLLQKGKIHQKLDQVHKELATRQTRVTADWLDRYCPDVASGSSIKKIIRENFRRQHVLLEHDTAADKEESVEDNNVQEANLPSNSSVSAAEASSTAPFHLQQLLIRHQTRLSSTKSRSSKILPTDSQTTKQESSLQCTESLPRSESGPFGDISSISACGVEGEISVEGADCASSAGVRCEQSNCGGHRSEANTNSVQMDEDTEEHGSDDDFEDVPELHADLLHAESQSISVEITIPDNFLRPSTSKSASKQNSTIARHSISKELDETRSDEKSDKPEVNFGSYNKPKDRNEETSDRTQHKEEVLNKDFLLSMERDKVARETSDQSASQKVYEECQELLTLFGIPYLVSPGEAEAQCACLEQKNLVQATVTDDSDIWLFGGRRVYRHLFNRQKNVQYFNSSELENVLGLSREKLIKIAMLTGCDYTDGVENVGVVAALEILSEFTQDSNEQLSTLLRFKNWWEAAQKQDTQLNPTRRRLRNLSCVFPSSFPDSAVWEAFMQPSTDQSDEKFAWGRPRVDDLKRFAYEKIGWLAQRVDELMLPVIRVQRAAAGTTGVQTHISSFAVNLVPDPAQMRTASSKRVEDAIKRMKNRDAPTQSGSGRDLVGNDDSVPHLNGAGTSVAKQDEKEIVVQADLSAKTETKPAKKPAKARKKPAQRKPKSSRPMGKTPDCMQECVGRRNAPKRTCRQKAAPVKDFCISESSSDEDKT